MNTTTETKMVRKTSKTTDLAKRIARAIFPEYKGRKIRVVARGTYTMSNFWDGGSRSYVKAVNLETAAVAGAGEITESPFNEAAHATFEIPGNVALVEHSFFCGQDAGITIIVNPTAARALAGAGAQALLSAVTA